jgi:hypothetical protein
MPPSEAATSPQRVRVSLLLDEVFEETLYFYLEVEELFARCLW